MNKTKMKELNKELWRIQSYQCERVPLETQKEAAHYISTIKPSTVEELFMYCACLNVMNTFVKQTKNVITYYFKEYINDVVIPSLMNINSPEIKYFLTNDRGMSIFYICFGEVMMSFHRVFITPNHLQQLRRENGYDEALIFDGVRKQRCAVSLYNAANAFLQAGIAI